MKKRHLSKILASLILAFAVILGIAAPAVAFADSTVSFELPDGQTAVVPVVSDRSQRVFDYARLFSDTEKAEITSRIASAEAKKKCEIMVLTSEDVPVNTGGSGKSYSRLYAEEFMKQNAEKEDAFILEIDMKNRKDVSVGHGKYGQSKYNDEMQKIADSLTNHRKNRQYADAAYAYIQKVDDLDSLLKKLIPTLPSLLISAVLAGITLLILVIIHNSSRAKVEKNLRSDEIEYEQTGHEENYLGTRTEVRHIERSSSSDGDSGGGFSGGGGDFSGGEASF